jgi:hypothetical protein
MLSREFNFVIDLNENLRNLLPAVRNGKNMVVWSCGFSAVLPQFK